ncbi:MAG: hypothetical protein ABIH23_06190 [bacterium]
MKNLILATALLLSAIGCASVDTAPKTMMGMPLLLDETFEDGADRWEPPDPSAFAVLERDGNHVYAIIKDSSYQPPVRSPQNITILKDLCASDFVLEVNLMSTTEDYGHRDMCVLFGYQDPSHYYYVHFGLKADPHSNSIFLVNGVPRVSIAKTRTEGTRWIDNTFHTVRIVRRVASGDIEVYFDNMVTPVMTACDTTLKKGRFGVGSFDDTGHIDNYRIWGIAATK